MSKSSTQSKKPKPVPHKKPKGGVTRRAVTPKDPETSKQPIPPVGGITLKDKKKRGY